MKIGVVTTSYPRSAGDPAGNFVGAHVDAMRALGHDVEVIAAIDEGSLWQRKLMRMHGLDVPTEPQVTRIASNLFYGYGAPDQLERATRDFLSVFDPRRVRDLISAVFPPRGAPPNAFGSHPLRDLIAALTFPVRQAREVSRHTWDLIVAHWLAPSALAALPSRTPLLAIAHGGDIHLLARLRLLAPALYLLRARNARLVFVSEALRDVAKRAAPRLARWLDDAALVQPMGIDLARFSSIPRTPTSTPTILVAGRLVPVKGFDVAIRALAHLRVPVRLVIAGGGPQRETLYALADEVQRSPGHLDNSLGARHESRHHTEFLGPVDGAHRDRLLGEASVVVVPSRVLPNGRTEGTPLIALEALAAGARVVASAVGGLRELPNVQLVAPDDPHALAAAIDRALATPTPRADLSDFDWRCVASRLLDHATQVSSSRRDA